MSLPTESRPTGLAAGLLAVLAIVAAGGCSDSLPPIPNVEGLPPAAQAQIRSANGRATASPLSASASESLGSTLFAHGFLEASVLCFERCLGLDPQGMDCAYLLGVAQSELGQFAAARDAFEAAESIRWRDIPTSLRLADLLERDGESERAVEILERVLRMEPSSAAAHYRLGRIAADDPARAIPHFEAALSSVPEHPDVLRALASALREVGRESDADEVEARVQGAGTAGGPEFQDPRLDAIAAIRSEGDR